jgi:hypothetical protein
LPREVDPTIPGPALEGIVAVDRLAFTEPDGSQTLRRDCIPLRQGMKHCLSSMLRKHEIVRVRTETVGMSLDGEAPVGMLGRQHRDG